MKRTILKHLHRPLQLIPAALRPCGLLITGTTHVVSRRIKFNTNCAYDLQSEDQYDWNKLFGVCFGLTGIHKNSLRFGWRYNKDTHNIELCTIVYREDSSVERKHIEDIALNQWGEFELTFRVEPYYVMYNFVINGRTVLFGAMPTPPAMTFWGCGLYFGGNRRAPHRITVNIDAR